jgi:hypothetical protein
VLQGSVRWQTKLPPVTTTTSCHLLLRLSCSWRKGRGFEARIKRGQQLYLGIFDTEEEAIAVRGKVKERLDAADGIITAVTSMTLPAVVGPPPDRTMTPSAASVIQYVMGMGIMGERIFVGPLRESRSSTRIVSTKLLELNGGFVALRLTSGVASSFMSVSSTPKKRPSPSVVK